MNKKNGVALVGVFSFLISVVIVVLFFGYQLVKKPVSDDSTQIIFEVQPGASLTQIATNLQQTRLVRNARVFLIYARFKGQASKIKVGEYSLNQAMSPDEILAVLVSGKSLARSITIAEGFNIFDMAALFEKNGISTQKEFLDLVYDPVFIEATLGEKVPSLEGYLFPETYKYTKFEGLRTIVTQMVKRFQTVWNEQVGAEKNKLPTWSRHQIITLASIVEKETGAAFERPIVSSVFHNRLAQNMRLQTDPTVLYGMAVVQKKMPTNITKKDLLTPTPYNTYTEAGLPPAPIANPGLEAIRAVLNPAQTKYLFFVSQNNGTHVFSETIQEHNKAVQQYQLNAKARENKSWRDLKQAPTTNNN